MDIRRENVLYLSGVKDILFTLELDISKLSCSRVMRGLVEPVLLSFIQRP